MSLPKTTDPNDLFGRIRKQADPRNALFLAAPLLEEAKPPEQPFRFFQAIPSIRQNGPTCVGHSGAHWEGSAPLMTKPWDDPYLLYAECQAVDPWAGTPHDGTTIEALMKVLRARRRIMSYHWSTSAIELRDWHLRFGTAILGIDWEANMMDPETKGSRKGFVSLGGGFVGGHAVLSIGYSQTRHAFRILNSWGRGWGDLGRCWVAFDDMAELLARPWAECALGLEERLAKALLPDDVIRDVREAQEQVTHIGIAS